MPGLVAAPAGAGLLPPLLPPPSPPLKVIVQQLDPNDPLPAVLVSLLGGTVTEQLPIVTGFAATIPSSILTQIAGLPGVRAISGNHPVVPSAAGSSAPRPSVHREIGREHVGTPVTNAHPL